MLTPDASPLQADMFSGEWIDNRTHTQKQQDKTRSQPQQLSMFRDKELAQFGVSVHPLLPISPHILLRLVLYDPRTPEQIEADQQRAAQAQTYPLPLATQPYLRDVEMTHPDYHTHLLQQPQLPAPMSDRAQKSLLLKGVQQTPSDYLRQLETTLQLPAPPEKKLLACMAVPLLSMTTSPDFESWLLESPLGQEVYGRITQQRHAVDLDPLAAYFDTVEDIQQKALIWLWQLWQSDPQYIQLLAGTHCFSHAAGLLTRASLRRARCLYAKRRYEGRERQSDLFFADGNEHPQVSLLATETIRATHLHDHDRPVSYADKHFDIQAAIERTVQRMLVIQQQPCKDGKASGSRLTMPMEHITRTIIEGHMYHYTDRYNQTGTFRQFCENKGVSRHQIRKWRPTIFEYLREELGDYAPE